MANLTLQQYLDASEELKRLQLSYTVIRSLRLRKKQNPVNGTQDKFLTLMIEKNEKKGDVYVQTMSARYEKDGKTVKFIDVTTGLAVDVSSDLKDRLGRKFRDVIVADANEQRKYLEMWIGVELSLREYAIIQDPLDLNDMPPVPGGEPTAGEQEKKRLDDQKEQVVTTEGAKPEEVSGQKVETKKLPLRFSLAGQEIKIDAKKDLPDFYVFIGLEGVDGDDVSGYDEIDPEYLEDVFQGMGEEEFEAVSGKIVEEQLDSLKFEIPNMEIPKGVSIEKFGDESKLYELAGDAARKLGKNGRVTTENMKKSYNGAIHGLCPQGTMAMVVALTGVWGLGKLSGHADWFAWKNSGTGGGTQNLAKKIDGVAYYNDKVQITKKDGSWKGTYIKDSAQWQIGDVVAMGYTSRAYGHIQVWTGYSWQSDFKQGKNIQQNSVDENNVALWRLNSNGVAKVRSKSGSV